MASPAGSMDEVPKKKPAGYLEENLIPGESLKFRAHVHWVVLIGPVLTALVLAAAGGVLIYYGASGQDLQWLIAVGIAFIIVGAAIVLRAVLLRNATTFAVTNKRIILKVGLARRRSEEILLQKVESIIVDQGFWGQMLHYGSVT